jgi:hypothetical protein
LMHQNCNWTGIVHQNLIYSSNSISWYPTDDFSTFLN